MLIGETVLITIMRAVGMIRVTTFTDEVPNSIQN